MDEGGETEISGRVIGDYLVTERVGAGSNAVVWKAEHVTSGRIVALKVVNLSNLNRRLRESLDCEVAFLSKVDHPNIVHLFEVIQDNGYLFFVLEFCAGGDLSSYIQRYGRVPEQTAKRFTQQLAAGLEVMHAQHVIHRDLKPENILLSTPDGNALLKICDFSLSRIVDPGDDAETVCGSPLYMAPEVLQFQKYNEKVDMWSLGAIIFELLNGYPPFRGRNNVQLLQNITTSTRLPFSQLVLRGLHPDCLDMCTRLLCKNPAMRLSFEEFYHHKFLTDRNCQTTSVILIKLHLGVCLAGSFGSHFLVVEIPFYR